MNSTSAAEAPPVIRIPGLIKRNIALFALSQSFTGAGMQFAYGLGGLTVIYLTNSAALAGLAVALLGLSRFLVAYPIGRVTDKLGRKPGILLGLVLALMGSIIVGLASVVHGIATFTVGMLMFGMGMNAAQQLRVAATDMVPPRIRAQALGYVALGSLAGLFASPLIVEQSERIAPQLGQNPLSLPWFFLPFLIVPGMLLVKLVKPDPKVIGMNLSQYYPENVLPPKRTGPAAPPFTVPQLLRVPSIRLAILSNCAAQGNMSIVMVLTSLVLHHHGSSLGAIAMSQTLHTTGMFAFTIPLGKLADRIGRNKVMIPGVAVTLVGAALVAFTGDFFPVTLGAFLVGLGWAAANVASTALIADYVDTAQRGRAIGVSDSFAGGVSVVASVITGPLIDAFSLSTAGLIAVLLAVPPLVMLPLTRRAMTPPRAAE
ncbi:MAG TPA: MFS transporter [Stellaceae bacterium]|nr:MFS transporter [Stellaceae bacterium]